jgi:predicted ArsR family transcriptional regulator
MGDTILSSLLRIEAPDQVAVFLDARRRRILLAFLGRERSLTQGAEALGMSLNLLAYHVGRLRRLGLLKVVREQKRAGRPILFYRASADSFLIPAAAMGRRVGDGLTTELRAALDRADSLSGASDMLVVIDEAGEPRLERRGATVDADACEYWRVLSLGQDEARMLNRELRALLRRYGGAPGRGKATYLAHVALAPRGGR